MSLKSPEPLTSIHLMFRDTALRLIRSVFVGVIIYHISAEAKDFYVTLGFDPSLLEPIVLNDLRACQVEEM
jgi:hypothetical protein